MTPSDSPKNSDQPAGTEPVNLVNGVPDCNPVFRWRNFLILLGIFVLWAVFLVYCRCAGRLGS